MDNILNLSKEALEAFQNATKSNLAKAVTTTGVQQATGLVEFDLQAPAKNLYPVLSPIGNMIPRVSGGGGTATNWKVVQGINVNKVRPGVPEGQRGAVVAISTDDKAASYKSVGHEDAITFEAEAAGKGFEDVRATQAVRLLHAAKISEELMIWGGNNSMQLAQPSAPTCAASGTDGSIPAATYNVIVVALTHAGFSASDLTNGVTGLVTQTGADGKTYTYGGGASQASSATAVVVAANQSVSASTPAVPGAVGYAWYAGPSGSERLQAFSSINSVKLTALSTTSQLLSAANLGVDRSKNTYEYDGLLATALKAGSGAYVKYLATGTPGTGTQLTSSGDGGVAEIETALKWFWDNARLSPSHIFVSADQIQAITKLVIANGGAPLFRFNVDGGGMTLNAGAVVGNYLNRYTLNGGQLVKVQLHPNATPGTMLFYTNSLPYPINGVPNVAEMRMRKDWYQIEWPLRTRTYETGVYADGVMAHYAPFALGVIGNIAA